MRPAVYEVIEDARRHELERALRLLQAGRDAAEVMERPEMAAVLPMTRKLKAELPAMLAEHRQIVLALEKLGAAAKTAGRPEYERFAWALVQHAETEERVLYPAVILLGEHLERTLKKEAVMPDVA